jgi:hypothetical protein
VDKSWDDVFDDRPGAVEVAVVRHAFGHGTREIDDGAGNRLRAAGSAWVAGPLPTPPAAASASCMR